MSWINRGFMGFAMAALLAGCAVSTTFQVRPDLPREQVAALLGDLKQTEGDFYTVRFTMYGEYKDGHQSPLKEVQVDWHGYPARLELPAGRYALRIVCHTARGAAYLPMLVDLEGGANYKVGCQPVTGQVGGVEAVIEKVNPT